jgi:phosphoglycolate phosphatase-like HAD superfamily hydrolase
VKQAAFALDFDGTLVSCRERHVALAAAIVDELGVSGFDPDRFWAAKEAGASTRAALVRLGIAEAHAARVAALWGERIEDPDWLRLDRPLPGARAAVDRVRAAGMSPLLLTARRDPAAVRDEVARAGLAAAEEVVVVSPFAAAEQKAERLRAAGALGFVGDTESDAQAAAAAGVRFAAVAGGQRSREYLSALGLEVHAGVLDATLAILGDLGRG